MPLTVVSLMDLYMQLYMMMALGMIVSSFVWGYLSDKFGRQKVLAFGYFGDVIFTTCTGFAYSYWTLLCFKFLSGVMICGLFSILMSYLSEMFSAKHRDSVVLVVGFCQSIGGILQPLLAWIVIPQTFKWSLFDDLISINSWHLFLILCAMPSLISGCGILLCPESPKYLLAMGRKEEALQELRTIYSINSKKLPHTYPVEKLKSESGANSNMTFFEQMTALFRPPFVLKAFLAFSIQLGGLGTFNSIRLWLPQLYSDIKESQGKTMNTCDVITGNHTRRSDCKHFKVDTSVYLNMIYVSILTAVLFAVNLAVIRHIGKRNVLVTLFLLQSAVICSLGWMPPSATSVMAAIFVALSYNCTIGIVGFVVQIFPTTLRTMAVSLTMMFGRIGAASGNVVMPHAISLSCPGTFLGISFITLICALTVLALATASSKNPPQQVVQPGQSRP